MLPLPPMFAPNPSGRVDGVVQSSLDEDSVNRSVADRPDALNSIVPQIAFDLVRSPMFAAFQLQDEVHGFLRGLVVMARSLGFDPYPLPPFFPVDTPPAIDGPLINP